MQNGQAPRVRKSVIAGIARQKSNVGGPALACNYSSFGSVEKEGKSNAE